MMLDLKLKKLYAAIKYGQYSLYHIPGTVLSGLLQCFW